MSANPHAMARAATTISALAVLSPVAGLAVEVALAWRFGTSPTVDAFRIGALLLVLGQQVFVGQILPYTVVPIFTEYRTQGREKEAWHVALSLANLLLVPMLLLSLLVFFRPEPVVHLFAPGLAGEARETATLFIRWFLLTYGLLVWSGVATGLLYAHGIFWLPPAMQLMGNVILVALILSLGSKLGAVSLVWGVLLSAALGCVMYASKLLPLMRQAGAPFPWRLDTKHPGVRRALVLALPMLGAVVVMQWTSAMVTRALSQLPSGSLALFGYSWKMGLLVSVVPLALATVMFPRFAEARFSPSGEEFRQICTRALRMALFLAIPLSAWLYALRFPVVALLLKRGAFAGESSEAVSRLFGLLLLGAPAAAAAAFMEKMFYALEKTRILLYTQLASAALLTALAGGVTKIFGAEGLMVFAGPVVAFLTATGFFLVLSRRHRTFLWTEVLLFTSKILALALVSAWIAREVSVLFERISVPSFFSLVLVTAGGLAAGATAFLAAGLACQVPEAVACSRYLRWWGDAIVKRAQSGTRG